MRAVSMRLDWPAWPPLVSLLQVLFIRAWAYIIDHYIHYLCEEALAYCKICRTLDYAKLLRY